MMKTGKWFKSFWAGKKKGAKQQTALPEDSQSAPIQSPAPKDKKRWSFRRSTGAGKETGPTDSTNVAQIQHASEAEVDQKKHAKVVVAAAEAAVAAAKAADIVIRLSTTPNSKTSTIDEKAATKIQAVFRSYLARKALKALRGLVKLQALVRGHLVRKQATATLRCMQALVTVQARARAQRIHMVDDSQRQSIQRRSPSPQNQRYRRTNESERHMEENVKIVEMDIGEAKGNFRSRNGYSIGQNEKKDQRHFSNYDRFPAPYNADHYQQASPALSAITDISSRACSSHFGEFSFNTVQSSPQYYSAISRPYSIREYSHYPQPDDTYSISNEHLLCPSYMANTESSKAKARSQSAPKQRPETCERQPSRRRPSVEGRNIPRGVRMQRSSSQVGQPLQANQYPWSIKLDKSNLSLKDSECASTSTILTNAYCRSVAAYEGRDYRH